MADRIHILTSIICVRIFMLVLEIGNEGELSFYKNGKKPCKNSLILKVRKSNLYLFRENHAIHIFADWGYDFKIQYQEIIY